jgi:hypothetical protein
MVGLRDDKGEGLQFLTEHCLTQDPAGQTPMCEQINAVVTSLQQIDHDLRALGMKAGVIIATDGESTDGDVAAAMKVTFIPSLCSHTLSPALVLCAYHCGFES